MPIRRNNAFTVMEMLVVVAIIATISAIIIPNPADVVKHPLGTESIKVGMTKEQVESIWGKPSQVKLVEDKAKWQGTRRLRQEGISACL